MTRASLIVLSVCERLGSISGIGTTLICTGDFFAPYDCIVQYEVRDGKKFVYIFKSIRAETLPDLSRKVEAESEYIVAISKTLNMMLKGSSNPPPEGKSYAWYVDYGNMIFTDKRAFTLKANNDINFIDPRNFLTQRDVTIEMTRGDDIMLFPRNASFPIEISDREVNGTVVSTYFVVGSSGETFYAPEDGDVCYWFEQVDGKGKFMIEWRSNPSPTDGMRVGMYATYVWPIDADDRERDLVWNDRSIDDSGAARYPCKKDSMIGIVVRSDNPVKVGITFYNIKKDGEVIFGKDAAFSAVFGTEFFGAKNNKPKPLPPEPTPAPKPKAKEPNPPPSPSGIIVRKSNQSEDIVKAAIAYLILSNM